MGTEAALEVDGAAAKLEAATMGEEPATAEGAGMEPAGRSTHQQRGASGAVATVVEGALVAAGKLGREAGEGRGRGRESSSGAEGDRGQKQVQ